MHRFSVNPITILAAGFPQESTRASENAHGNQKGQTICKEENEVGGLTPLNFKFYYKAILIQTMRYWHKDSYTDQQNRTESRNKP